MSATALLLSMFLLKVVLEVCLALSHRAQAAEPRRLGGEDQSEDEEGIEIRAHDGTDYQSGHLPSEEYSSHAGSMMILGDFRQEPEGGSNDLFSVVSSQADDGWQ